MHAAAQEPAPHPVDPPPTEPPRDAAADAPTAPVDESTGDVCSDAYEQAQVLMRPKLGRRGTLLEAREQLFVCMRSGCKDWMVAECSRWLPEVEGRIPTLVLSARNTAGRDLIDVRVVTASGQQLTERLDGRTIEFEPGEQTFIFETPDGARSEKVVLIREGVKAQSVSAVFDASPEELAARSPSSNLPAPDRGLRTSTSPLQYVGYGLAGVGVVGVGIGTFFGLSALVSKGDASCDASGLCDNGAALDDAKAAAPIATVAFVAGGALVAGGLSLVLFTPSRARVTARAAVLPGGGSVGLGGSF